LKIIDLLEYLDIEDNVKVELNEKAGFEGMDLINLAQNHCWALVGSVMNLQVL
jgi:hypothetical protein